MVFLNILQIYVILANFYKWLLFKNVFYCNVFFRCIVHKNDIKLEHNLKHTFSFLLPSLPLIDNVLMFLNYGYFMYILFWQTVFRPDITAMVDWALKINYLCIWLFCVPNPVGQAFLASSFDTDKASVRRAPDFCPRAGARWRRGASSWSVGGRGPPWTVCKKVPYTNLA